MAKALIEADLTPASREREPKRVSTANPDGEPIELHGSATAQDELKWLVGRVRALLDRGVPSSEVAVLARTNNIAKEVRDELVGAGVLVASASASDLFSRRSRSKAAPAPL